MSWAMVVEKRLQPLGQQEVAKGLSALAASAGGMPEWMAAFAIVEGAGLLTEDEWRAGRLDDKGAKDGRRSANSITDHRRSGDEA
jgi:hypothetical protein